MHISKFLFIAISVMIISSCANLMTPEEDRKKCLSRGYADGGPNYKQCLKNLEADRQPAYQAVGVKHEKKSPFDIFK